jgi:Patatin-like phospholipase
MSNLAHLKECDIIMKGGITSGVVYPKAILALSECYRFRSIGGTSAGAIAAVVTAGAEFNRTGGGFKTIAALPGEIRTKLGTLFQPSPPVRALFNVAKFGFLEKRWARALGWLLSSYWLPLMIGVFAGGVAAAITLSLGNRFAALLLLLIGFAAGVLFLLVSVLRTILIDLKALDFGFCPGRTQAGNVNEGLSDWLAAKIEIAAGRMQEGGPRPQIPLTFGDIWRGPDGTGSDEKPAIDLRMMTTNLSLRRPHALPHMDRNHYFRELEFRQIFPDWIVDYLVANAQAEPNKDVPAGYCTFPSPARLPLVVAARMSLSFPILFATIPLYRLDYSHKGADGKPIIERMLFSDGGLSSNFPIHFFDALLPKRPTFGISLESYDERDPNRRVRLPMSASRGILLDSGEIDSLPNFLVGLVNAAKDWQDRLQSTLPGYRERIANIYLKSEEGGTNMNMSPTQIDKLVKLGERGAALMVGQPLDPSDESPFDFDEHRWRRYLIAFARLEEALAHAEQSWNGPVCFGDFIKSYKPTSYHSPEQWRREVFSRFDAIMSLVAGWGGKSLRFEKEAIPRPASELRITPKP